MYMFTNNLLSSVINNIYVCMMHIYAEMPCALANSSSLALFSKNGLFIPVS